MRKSIFVILFLGLIIGACHNNSDDDYSWDYFYDDDDEIPTVPEEDEGGGNITISPSFHGTQTVDPGYNARLEDLGRAVYPELIPIEDDAIGGVKLCSEMSADRNGNNKSTTPDNIPAVFYSYEQLGLVLLDVNNNDCDGLPNILSRLIYKEVLVEIGKVCGNPDAIWGNGPSFQVSITITNNRLEDTDVEIPQGTMLEAQNDGVQNIVVSESVSVKLSPSQKKIVTVKAMCAARKRSDPTGSKVRLTPFRLNVPSWAYQTKEDLWNKIESYRHTPKEYTITFYAWGMGDPNGAGEPSQFGHAFVDIPGVGLVGYGGRVFDHSHLQQNATVSATVRVSQSDLENAQRKYYEWMNDTRGYEFARHDCTSFVMDIADAAHIWYGLRWSIQFPATFVRAVNFYNKWNN